MTLTIGRLSYAVAVETNERDGRPVTVDFESVDVDEAPYTESPDARLRAVQKYTEKLVAAKRVSRWA